MRRNILIMLLLMCFAASAYAQSSSYSCDKYAADVESQKHRRKTTLQSVIDSPKYAVRSAKFMLRKAVIWIESYKLVPKIEYVYDEITDYGFYPLFTDIGDRHANIPGVEFNYGVYQTDRGVVDLPFALQYHKTYSLDDSPIAREVIPNVWLSGGFRENSDSGVQCRFADVLGIDDSYAQGTVRHQDFSNEDYFTEGPNYSIADGAAFSLEETSVALSLGKKFLETITMEVGAGFSSVDVVDAKGHDKRNIQSISGLHGMYGINSATVGFSLERDNRDNDFDPKRGGFQRVKVSLYEGVNGADARYVKYRYDAAEYFPIGEYLPFLYWNSALGFRVQGEMNDGLNHGTIPFYDLARLGGVDSVRGYQANRFYDENSLSVTAEYRYNIWSMKEYKVDASIFYDCGWIFDDASEFEFNKAKDSVGFGFRILSPRFTLALQGAHSGEGNEVYFSMKPVF